MWGFIYLADLRLEGIGSGGSCRGAEGTAVPQRSVPHYCFVMRTSGGLQRVSHLAVCCETVGVVPQMLLWVSVRSLCRGMLHCCLKLIIRKLERVPLVCCGSQEGNSYPSSQSQSFCSRAGYFPGAVV